MHFLDSPRQRAAALVIAASLIVCWAAVPFLAGLIAAPVFAVLCAPLYDRLRCWLPAQLAAGLVVLIVLAMVLVPTAALGTAFVDQAPVVLERLRESRDLAELSRLRVGRVDVGAEVVKMGGTALSWLSTHAMKLAGGFARGLMHLAIGCFGLFFLLLGRGHAWPAVRRLLPFSAERADQLADRFRRVTYATVVGTALVAVVQGTLVGLGFWVVGFPNVLFWGAMATLCAVIPLVGSTILWLPAVLLLFVSGRVGAALGLAALCTLVVAQVDNVVRPLVFRRYADIHPMVTLLGVLGGLRLVGIPGIILGPLAIVYVGELYRIYHEEYGVTVTPPIPSESSGGTDRGASAVA